MRFFTLVFVLLSAQLGAHAAPRKVPVAPLKATVLSPEKLPGKLAYTQKGDLWVIDPSTRQKHRLLLADVTTHIPNRAPGFVYEAEEWAFNPDLKSVAAKVTARSSNETPDQSVRAHPQLNASEALYVFFLDGRRGRPLIPFGRNDFSDVRWSPDGKQISYTRSSWYDLDENVVRGPNYIPSTSMGHLYEVCIIGSDGKNVRLIAGKRTDIARNAFWSRDSKRLLFTNGFDEMDTLQTIALDGSNPRPFNGDWSDFLRPEGATEAKIRAEFVGGSDAFAPRNTNQKIRTLQLVSVKPKQVLFIIWADYEGFSLDGTVAVDARAEHVAFGGELNSVTLDSQGFLRLPSSQFLKGRGIYLQKLRNGQVATVDEPRLIVLEGQLIGWL